MKEKQKNTKKEKILKKGDKKKQNPNLKKTEKKFLKGD